MRDSQETTSEAESDKREGEKSKGARVLQLPRMDEREPRVKGERAILPRVYEEGKNDFRRSNRSHNTVKAGMAFTIDDDEFTIFVSSVPQQETRTRGEDV